MPEAVTDALINAGILGPILVAVGWYVLRLQRQLTDAHAKTAEAQEKRVEDAQRVATQLLELNDRWSETVAAQSAAFDEQRNLIGRVHDLLGDLKAALQSRTAYPIPAAPPGGNV
jgi:hypothetical protein